MCAIGGASVLLLSVASMWAVEMQFYMLGQCTTVPFLVSNIACATGEFPATANPAKPR